MGAFTSFQSGNWSAGSTWVGGAAPANGGSPGDTVTIANTHVVTADVNWTIGSSPPSAGTAAITVTGTTGKLIIGTGVTLVARGDVTVGDTPFTMNAGSVLEFDASAATSPTSQHYVLRLGVGTGANCIVTISGTSGSHCTIRSNAGGGTGSVGSGARYHATISYCDFLNLGTAGVEGIRQGSGGRFDLSNCIFDTCGTITFLTESATEITRLLNCTMKNTVSGACTAVGAGSTALTSGTRLISGCVFDKAISNGWRDYTITNTLLNGVANPYTSSGSFPWASFTNNLLVWGGTNDALGLGSIADCYCLANHSTSNPHFLTFGTGIGSVTVSGCVFQYLGTQNNGDCVTIPVATVPSTYTIEHNITLPNGGGGCAGTMTSALGGANVTVVSRHNTIFVGAQTGVAVGETYAGHAGMLAEFRDNLCWDTSARGYKLRKDLTAAVSDLILSANAHHNAGYFMLPGTNLKGYENLVFSSGAPGANDVDGVDPNFVDSTRNIQTWDASLAGGGGSTANALIELKKHNDAGYNPAYTIAALLAYVKAGFVPQASEMHAASDSVGPSNGWIGALEGPAPAPPTDMGGALRPRYHRFVMGG